MTVDRGTGEILVDIGIFLESKTHIDPDGYPVSGLVVEHADRLGVSGIVACYLVVHVYRRGVQFHTIDADDATVISGLIVERHAR